MPIYIWTTREGKQLTKLQLTNHSELALNKLEFHLFIYFEKKEEEEEEAGISFLLLYIWTGMNFKSRFWELFLVVPGPRLAVIWSSPVQIKYVGPILLLFCSSGAHNSDSDQWIKLSILAKP